MAIVDKESKPTKFPPGSPGAHAPLKPDEHHFQLVLFVNISTVTCLLLDVGTDFVGREESLGDLEEGNSHLLTPPLYCNLDSLTVHSFLNKR